MAEKKWVRYNAGYINGEVVEVKVARILNKGSKNEALKLTLLVDVGNNITKLVDYFVSKYKFGGEPNQTYAKLRKIAEGCKDRVGSDDGVGDMVNCSVSFENNAYVNRDGKIIEGLLLRGVFCGRQEDVKFTINSGSRGSLYGVLKERKQMNGYLEMTFLCSNYAYVNKDGEVKADGFYHTVRTYNEDYIEYIMENIKEEDILFYQFECAAKAKKSRGIGKASFLEEYFDLTSCSAPLMSLDEEGKYVKCVYDDLEEGQEEEECYTVCERDDFPFKEEFIKAMLENIENKKAELQAKAEEILNAQGEDDIIDGNEIPF